MAYISQETKKEKLAKIKAVIKEKYPELKVKFSMGIRHYSEIYFTLRESTIDFESYYRMMAKKNAEYFEEFNEAEWQFSGNVDVNHYHLDSHFDGKPLEFLQDVSRILFEGHWDESDAMTDYFHTAYYVTMSIGDWNKPYKKVS